MDVLLDAEKYGYILGLKYQKEKLRRGRPINLDLTII